MLRLGLQFQDATMGVGLFFWGLWIGVGVGLGWVEDVGKMGETFFRVFEFEWWWWWW